MTFRGNEYTQGWVPQCENKTCMERQTQFWFWLFQGFFFFLDYEQHRVLQALSFKVLKDPKTSLTTISHNRWFVEYIFDSYVITNTTRKLFQQFWNIPMSINILLCMTLVFISIHHQIFPTWLGSRAAVRILIFFPHGASWSLVWV